MKKEIHKAICKIIGMQGIAACVFLLCTGCKLEKDLKKADFKEAKQIERIAEENMYKYIKHRDMRSDKKYEKVKPEMILVEGGSFLMGTNTKTAEECVKPAHEVYVGTFLMGKYEVTQIEWKKTMGSNPSTYKGGHLPVHDVSWFEAVEFCNRKSKAEKLQVAYTKKGDNVSCDFNVSGYRLPTEAEWEYAARGGNKSKGYKYSGSNNFKEVAWCYENAGIKILKSMKGIPPTRNVQENYNMPHKVGLKKANELGIHDMTGNLNEWCWDRYRENYYKYSPKVNPLGCKYSYTRVVRGGCWGGRGTESEIYQRGSSNPEVEHFIKGIRLVRTVIENDSFKESQKKKLASIKQNLEKVRKEEENRIKLLEEKEKQQRKRDMVFIEGGTFLKSIRKKGKKKNSSYLAPVDSFYMSKTKITQLEYKNNYEGFYPEWQKDDHKPALFRNWISAIGYCNKLSKKDGLRQCYNIDGYAIKWDLTANGYRLPTKMEWEYVFEKNKKIKVKSDEIGKNGVNERHNEWCWEDYDEKNDKNNVMEQAVSSKENEAKKTQKEISVLYKARRNNSTKILGLRLVQSICEKPTPNK